jgi:hypothetical protein
MSGMNNKTSKELSSAKLESMKYHSKKDQELYQQYLESNDQYSKTFLKWKQDKNKKNIRHGKMQKPLTPEQLKERGYNTKNLNQSCRWK